jgi:hypothetical protein
LSFSVIANLAQQGVAISKSGLPQSLRDFAMTIFERLIGVGVNLTPTPEPMGKQKKDGCRALPLYDIPVTAALIHPYMSPPHSKSSLRADARITSWHREVIQ